MKKDWVLAVSFGELMLKGKNRNFFVQNAVKHIKQATKNINIKGDFFQIGKYFLSLDEADMDETVKAVQEVFGLVYITPALRVSREKEDILQAALYFIDKKAEELKAGQDQPGEITFKVESKRADKQFPMKSPEISAKFGEYILNERPELKVDVKNPDMTVHIEIRDDAFIFMDRYKGEGGLPAGSSGRGLLLLSGGIDSPAAGYELAKRGMSISYMHFHSYPFTSPRAKEKAVRLAEQLSSHIGSGKVYMINLRDSYIAIRRDCKIKNTTVLSRRMMMRIGDILCRKYGFDCMITGESLGQVASQTIQGISVVNRAAERPILRPFVASDKSDIIKIAKKIGTYDISIEPYDDCCSIFAPDKPNTRPNIKEIEEDEEKLDIEELIEKALESLEILDPTSPEDRDKLFE